MWSTVCRMIPWGQVIDHAPEVIEAAKKLYGQLTKNKPAEEDALEIAAINEDLTESERLQLLVEGNRQELLKLHEDIEASSRLINELAEQNAQMIGEIEKLRKRMKKITLLTTLAFFAALYLLYRAFFS